MRIIDSDALKEAINNLYEYAELDDVIQTIDNAPTVELTETEVQAVLNKRCMTAVTNEYLIALHGKRPTGEWIHHKGAGRKDFRECSVCKVWLDWDITRNSFCPNCGADMQKGAKS